MPPPCVRKKKRRGGLGLAAERGRGELGTPGRETLHPVRRNVGEGLAASPLPGEKRENEKWHPLCPEKEREMENGLLPARRKKRKKQLASSLPGEKKEKKYSLLSARGKERKK